jgi:hypothetical protein
VFQANVGGEMLDREMSLWNSVQKSAELFANH